MRRFGYFSGSPLDQPAGRGQRAHARSADHVRPWMTAEADAREARAAVAGVHADRQVEFVGEPVDRLVAGVVEHRVALEATDHHADGAGRLRVAHLGERGLHQTRLDDRDPAQPLRVGAAAVGDPAVVGARHRHLPLGIGQHQQQEHGREDHLHVDAHPVHVGEPRAHVAHLERPLAGKLVVLALGAEVQRAAHEPVAQARGHPAAQLLGHVARGERQRPEATLRRGEIGPGRVGLVHMGVGIDDRQR